MSLTNVDRAREVFARNGVAFVVAATRENTLYLSGIDNHGQLAFPYTEQSYVVAPAEQADAGVLVLSAGRVEAAAAAYDSIADVIAFGSFRRQLLPAAELDAEEQLVRSRSERSGAYADAFEGLAAAIERAGAARAPVAVDERGPDRRLLERLAARFPDARFLPGAELVREIRAVKTAPEIDRMTRAIDINEAAFRAVFAAAHTGVTESELRREFNTTVEVHGGTPGHCLLKFGRRMALFQDPRGDAQLASGEAIFIDAGATYRGYHSDLGRIVSYGEPSKRLITLYGASKAGQERAFELLRPGNPIADMFHGAVETARENGNPGFSRHHTGHAIGLEWNDHPMLSPGTDAIAEPGMVLEVELPYYELGFGGAHIEDTVLVDADGATKLSTLPRELAVLDVH